MHDKSIMFTFCIFLLMKWFCFSHAHCVKDQPKHHLYKKSPFPFCALKGALFAQVFQIFHCCYAGNSQVLHNEFNFRVWVPEQIIQQLLTIYFRQILPHLMFTASNVPAHPVLKLLD
jgi:hypothetical protein